MTYLLDTNVVSEIRKRRPDPNVQRWFEVLPPQSLHLSVLVIGELRDGIERLRDRDPQQAGTLDAWLTALLERYGRRPLSVDLPTAQEWGRLSATCGPLPPVDGLLAATGRLRGLTVASRNIAHFRRAGEPVVNPWDDAGQRHGEG